MMAALPPPTGPVGPDTLITIKVLVDGQNRRFKLALRDLGANTLPQKLRFLLAIPQEQEVRFDRYSDSAGTYVTLDSSNPSIYKQLFRAAKAKLKLRLKATVINSTSANNTSSSVTVGKEDTQIDSEKSTIATTQPEQRPSYLDTVLTWPQKLEAPEETAMPRAMDETKTVPGAFVHNEPVVDPAPRPTPRAVQLSQPTVPSLNDFSAGFYTIDCNNCNKSIPNEHYHCAICEQGDFDLCQACIDSGVNCHGDNHWLIKRFIHNGAVRTSMTETREQRKPKQAENTTEKTQAVEVLTSTDNCQTGRTCNSCICQLPDNMFVSCNDCDDYDVCFPCLEMNLHGHHPGHVFDPVDLRTYATNARVKELCGPNRAVKHHATCDGCDKIIVGVRHKCLTCPDWDFCDKCVPSAKDTHPGHRFAPIYGSLVYVPSRREVHRGIYCDGPICTAKNRKSYIKGDRYKCAVCHDTDFCANCEASPNNLHNNTHPLVKIRVPIRSVAITTFHESDDNAKVEQVGDRPAAKNAATETARTAVTNAATQVHTVAEVKPVEEIAVPTAQAPEMVAALTTRDLQAWYEADSTPDGSTFAPNRLVSQSWTLRNPGPEAWPAGCAVHFIGGDDMRNLDTNRPSSVTAMTNANRSNTLDYSLPAGKTAVFTVLLKSPLREGRAISYWRLKTPKGLPFGHKLWVDINVTSAPIELPIRSLISSMETATKTEEEEQDGSTMIFPKLEKESPVSSIHDVKAAPSITTETTVKEDEDQELLEDVESLELGGDDSDEDGFMTDEEYDILDASDEDFLEAQQTVVKK